MVLICSTQRGIWYHVVLICVIPHKLTHLAFEKKWRYEIKKNFKKNFFSKVINLHLATIGTFLKIFSQKFWKNFQKKFWPFFFKCIMCQYVWYNSNKNYMIPNVPMCRTYKYHFYGLKVIIIVIPGNQSIQK